MKNGEKNIAIEIKKFDVEIGRYLFEVNKDNKQPSPLQGRIIKYLSKHEGEDIKCIPTRWNLSLKILKKWLAEHLP